MFNLYDLAQATDYSLVLDVNGYEVHATFTQDTLANVVDPLLYQLDELVEEKGSRLVVFLAAAPGTGKSTFAAFLEKRYEELELNHWLQSCGLDGFHHTNAYLEAHGLSSLKGAPETFDVEAFQAKLDMLGAQSKIGWPVYDRSLHEPRPDALTIEGDIILIEGNWLLLDEELWRDLLDYADLSIYISAKEEQLKDRLIARKMRGNFTKEEALAHYESADGPNVRRCLAHSQQADVVLVMNDDGDFSLEA